MRKVLVLILLTAISIPAAAEWSRANLYGADVRALVIDPKHPDTIYLGTSSGEVYLSRDGGATWANPRHAIPFPGYVVDSLLVDGRGRLWAACWGLWGGGVVAVSDDGAVSWERRDADLDNFSVRSIAVDARNPDRLVAGGLTGIWRTNNAGRSWERISDQENVESLAIDPRNENRIYAGTWRQAFRTDDGGKSWSRINEGMVLDTDVFSILIDARNPDNIWLSTCGWVYNSANRGDKWTRFKNGFNNRRIHAVGLDPTDTSRVYAGSVAGLYRTKDLGKTWELISDENLVINAIGLHPERPQRIVLGTEGDGVYVSRDGGKTYERSSVGLRNVRVAALASDPVERNTLYAAVRFGGAASGVYRSTDSGRQWQKLSSTRLPEIISLLVRRDVSPRFLVGTEQGVFRSEDGVEWTASEPSTVPLRYEKLMPYNRDRLFAATAAGVFTSKDAGRSWYRLGRSYDSVMDLALGRLDGDRALYALTTEGLSVFDGSTWTPVKGAPTKGRTVAIRRDGEVEMVVVAGSKGVQAGHIDFAKTWHPTRVPTVEYAAVFQTDPSESRTVVLASRAGNDLFVSMGENPGWTPLTLPESSVEVAAVAADPFDAGSLYVGTAGQGIFIYRPDAAVPASRNQRTIYLGGSK